MNMKYYISTIILAFSVLSLMCQDINQEIEGTVSFVTTQSVYVKFQSTESLQVGDTLYIKQGSQLIPVLTIANLSSMSSVCNPIFTGTLKVNDIILAKPKSTALVAEEIEPVQEIILLPTEEKKDTITEIARKVEQDVYGRISVSSYTNFSNADADNSQRMRYTVSFNADCSSSAYIQLC